jgi:protein-disulfide isomerase
MRIPAFILMSILLPFALVAAPLPAPKTVVQKPTITAQDVVLGNAKAPVTIIEYASLSCPHCAHFHRDIMPELQKRYIDTGKAKFVFRHFPFNAPALRGSQLVVCSGKAKYYTFLKVLFKTQDTWAFSQNFLESLEGIAKLGGISKERFDACMADKQIEDRIVKERKDAETLYGVQSTPTVFVNGTVIPGVPTLEAIAKAIGK